MLAKKYGRKFAATPANVPPHVAKSGILESSMSPTNHPIAMGKKHNIQRVALASYDIPLHCPFCGACAHDPDPEKQARLKPCQHTLFMVHDEGFEYRSARFDQLMGIEGVADDDVELGDKGYDGFTDRVCCPDSVKFATFIPAPSFFGAYYGFAPEP